MTTPRIWDRLSEGQRKRYLAAGWRQGLTETGVRQYYESGQSLKVWRGKRPHAGASERQWSRMLAASRAARLREDVDGDPNVVLESLLAKGFKPQWIIDRLDEKKDSRDKYRSDLSRKLRKKGIAAGWEPGRTRYFKRNHIADIELYYYH